MKLFYTKHSNVINFTILLCFILTTLQGWSQDHKSEFSVNVGGIFSNLEYDFSEGYVDKNRGFSVGLGYAYYLDRQWSINIEGNYQKYNSEARTKALKGNYETTDFENETFEFRYEALGYKEKQEVGVLNIPLTVQFETDGDINIYIRAGAQVGIILNSNYNNSIENLSTSGYYEQYDVELFDPQFMGFGTFNNISQSDRVLDWDMSYSAVLESGFKAEVGNESYLYVGFFVNYGLNRISSEATGTDVVNYNSETPSDFYLGSLFDSGMAKEARLKSFGIKFRYALGI
ncbi:outer membrane beta-barrel protein [Winogradskyella wichelsiae]|uniref:outer membrane beta-barrel protein n=1 Tax=Winogradskyella wichelsiae TaxID=2697007 RepID=UPI003EF6BF92